MELKHPLPLEAIESFHLMWDNFPESVVLIHKSREVIAMNKTAENSGFLKPGMTCSKTGPPGAHKGCLADKALASRQATYVVMPLPDGQAISFWQPLDGYPEHFIHYNVGLSMDYRTGQPNDFSKLLSSQTSQPELGPLELKE